MKLFAKANGRRLATDGVRPILRRPSRGLQKTLLKHGGCLAAGFVLSGASVFEGCSPFALAFVSATAKTGFGFSAALGALLGAWFWGGGLKYAACTILIIAGIYILKDLPLLSKTYFVPLFTAALTACIGIIYAAADGWTRDAVVLLSLELFLTGAFSYFFPIALGSDDSQSPTRRKICRVLLLAAVLVTLQPLKLGGVISSGAILASAAAIYFGCWHGPMFGASAGLAIGIAMDAAAGTGIFFTGALAAGGLVAGVFAQKGRLFSALAYLVCMTGFYFWDGFEKTSLIGLYQCLAGAVIFYFVPELPDIFPVSTSAAQAPSTSSHQDRFVRGNASRRLQETAKAFSKLYAALSEVLTRPDKTENTEDISLVFVAAADKVCRKCSNRQLCWGKEDSATLNACNDVTDKLRTRGVVTPGDFPKYFSNRCSKIKDFCAAVSIEYASFLERRRARVRMARSQELLCRQYSELGRILSDTAAEFSKELSYDPRAMELLGRYLKKRGTEAQAVVYSDPSGRLHAEIRGGTEELKSPEAVEEMGKVLGMPLVVGEAGECLTLSQKEPLRAIAGSAAAPKAGQSVSGDSAMYFRSESGVLYIILSDGMGSGEDALEESRSIAGLLESFLKAGVEPEVAMRTLNGAMSLKTGEDGAFATLDLLQLDMFTGRAAFYKLGAAPTYIKRGSKVSRITASGLPPGTAFGSVAADVSRLTLSPGDFIIMASDGLTEKGSDEHILEKIAQYEEKSPRQLAAKLLAETVGEKGPSDDVTVFVIRLEENV